MNTVESLRFRDLSFFPLILLVTGVTLFGRDFAKLHLGPIYSTELLLILFWIFSFPAVLERKLKGREFFRFPILASLLFFVLGAVLAVLDYPSLAVSEAPMARSRFAQHCLIFIYPLLGLVTGYLAYLVNPSVFKKLALACLACSLGYNILGENIRNLSLGPLAAVLLSWYAFRVFISSEGKPRALSLSESLGVLLLAFFCFFPFWAMWLGSVQRTSFLLVLFSILLVPLLMRKKGVSLKEPLKVTLFLVVFFTSGLSVFLNVSSLTSATPTGFLSGFQHGDDMPLEGVGEAGRKKRHAIFTTIQARFRKFCWNRAVHQWSQKPVLGVGFVPEVPDMISPSQPNAFGFINDGEPPIIGPHNSYLTILARMGVVGEVLFFALFLSIAFPLVVLVVRSPSLENLLFFTVFFNGTVHALFNIGLESPHHSILMWLFAGATLPLLKLRSKTPEKETEPKTEMVYS